MLQLIYIRAILILIYWYFGIRLIEQRSSNCERFSVWYQTEPCCSLPCSWLLLLYLQARWKQKRNEWLPWDNLKSRAKSCLENGLEEMKCMSLLLLYLADGVPPSRPLTHFCKHFTTRQWWPPSSTLRLLTDGITDILGQMLLCCGDCPVHHGMFSSIPDLYKVDTSEHFQLWKSEIPADVIKSVMGSWGPL